MRSQDIPSGLIRKAHSDALETTNERVREAFFARNLIKCIVSSMQLADVPDVNENRITDIVRDLEREHGARLLAGNAKMVEDAILFRVASRQTNVEIDPAVLERAKSLAPGAFEEDK